MIRISILDDHELFRTGLREIFRKNSSFEFVDEYGSIEDCYENIGKNEPDILLLDITLDNGIGFDLIDRLKKSYTNLKIVMLTMHKKEFYVSRAIDYVVDGYINKDVSTDELFAGLKRIFRGERFFSSEVSRILLNNMYSNDTNNRGIRELTERQKEILDKIMGGKTSVEIADELNISKKTIDNHRANILKKFGFKSTTMLVRELAQIGEV